MKDKLKYITDTVTDYVDHLKGSADWNFGFFKSSNNIINMNDMSAKAGLISDGKSVRLISIGDNTVILNSALYQSEYEDSFPKMIAYLYSHYKLAKSSMTLAGYALWASNEETSVDYEYGYQFYMLMMKIVENLRKTLKSIDTFNSFRVIETEHFRINIQFTITSEKVVNLDIDEDVDTSGNKVLVVYINGHEITSFSVLDSELTIHDMSMQICDSVVKETKEGVDSPDAELRAVADKITEACKLLNCKASWKFDDMMIALHNRVLPLNDNIADVGLMYDGNVKLVSLDDVSVVALEPCEDFVSIFSHLYSYYKTFNKENLAFDTFIAWMTIDKTDIKYDFICQVQLLMLSVAEHLGKTNNVTSCKFYNSSNYYFEVTFENSDNISLVLNVMLVDNSRLKIGLDSNVIDDISISDLSELTISETASRICDFISGTEKGHETNDIVNTFIAEAKKLDSSATIRQRGDDLYELRVAEGYSLTVIADSNDLILNYTFEERMSVLTGGDVSAFAFFCLSCLKSKADNGGVLPKMWLASCEICNNINKDYRPEISVQGKSVVFSLYSGYDMTVAKSDVTKIKADITVSNGNGEIEVINVDAHNDDSSNIAYKVLEIIKSRKSNGVDNTPVVIRNIDSILAKEPYVQVKWIKESDRKYVLSDKAANVCIIFSEHNNEIYLVSTSDASVLVSSSYFGRINETISFERIVSSLYLDYAQYKLSHDLDDSFTVENYLQVQSGILKGNKFNSDIEFYCLMKSISDVLKNSDFVEVNSVNESLNFILTYDTHISFKDVSGKEYEFALTQHKSYTKLTMSLNGKLLNDFTVKSVDDMTIDEIAETVCVNNIISAIEYNENADKKVVQSQNQQKTVNSDTKFVNLRLVPLKYEDTLIGFRFKADNLKGYDISVDVAKAHGITAMKVLKAITLENRNGLLLSKSEISSGDIIEDISDNTELINKLMNIIKEG